MKKTIFNIAKMDCPSEEQMIRMKLSDLSNIQSMEFDIPNRKLTVLHTESYEPIFTRLDALKFDTSLLTSEAAGNVAPVANNLQAERKLLWQVLFINFAFFVIELSTGFISGSMGLVADSLDMLADSLVYTMALFVVGSAMSHKKRVSQAAGYFQLVLAALGIIEVARRFAGMSEAPVFQTMIVVSVLALLANGISLYLLQKSKSKEAHMQASMIFTSNDIIINAGVILAGVLVYFTQSKYPDLLVGAFVFVIVARGAMKILKL